jgi:putative PIN family toxin of toxin-antitoxin system
MPHVAVFDTNVLFSGIGWKGNPFECLRRAREGVVKGLTCREILDELAEKLETKLGLSAEHVAETLADLLSFLRLVEISGTLKVVAKDADDDKVLECAIVGQATYIVTGDRRHLLPLGSFRGIPIVSPAEFLRVAIIADREHDDESRRRRGIARLLEQITAFLRG